MKKQFSLLAPCVILASFALILAACGGSAAPTTAPTVSPATPAPVVSTATAAPNNTPTVAVSATNTLASGSGNNTDPLTALAKFQSATVFRLDAQAQVSRSIFKGKDTPAPGEDPNEVTIFTLKGEQKASDVHYALGGFVGSFIALATGFDPNSSNVELTTVEGKQYARGSLPGATEAKWYLIPDAQAASTTFDPKRLLSPVVSAKFQKSDFTKTGAENLDNHACDVYTSSHDAFTSVFSAMGGSLLLTPDNLDLGPVESSEFKLWVCDDGNLHQVRYAYGGHSKTHPDQKGEVTFGAHISDYDGAIAIQPPTDAVAAARRRFDCAADRRTYGGANIVNRFRSKRAIRL